MKISVADDPETVRVKKNMETVSNVVYHNEYQRKQNMEMMRPQEYDSVSKELVLYMYIYKQFLSPDSCVVTDTTIIDFSLSEYADLWTQ